MLGPPDLAKKTSKTFPNDMNSRFLLYMEISSELPEGDSTTHTHTQTQKNRKEILHEF